jgi:hypothetical protein
MLSIRAPIIPVMPVKRKNRVVSSPSLILIRPLAINEVMPVS